LIIGKSIFHSSSNPNRTLTAKFEEAPLLITIKESKVEKAEYSSSYATTTWTVTSDSNVKFNLIGQRYEVEYNSQDERITDVSNDENYSVTSGKSISIESNNWQDPYSNANGYKDWCNSQYNLIINGITVFSETSPSTITGDIREKSLNGKLFSVNGNKYKVVYVYETDNLND